MHNHHQCLVFTIILKPSNDVEMNINHLNHLMIDHRLFVSWQYTFTQSSNITRLSLTDPTEHFSFKQVDGNRKASSQHIVGTFE